MSTLFDVHQDVTIVQIHLWGPKGDGAADFVLDTGTSKKVVSTAVLVNLGYNPQRIRSRVSVTTASGQALVPRLALRKIEALEQECIHYPVLALDLPPSADIDGLLGLDFIRGQQLCIDYRNGTIRLF